MVCRLPTIDKSYSKSRTPFTPHRSFHTSVTQAIPPQGLCNCAALQAPFILNLIPGLISIPQNVIIISAHLSLVKMSASPPTIRPARLEDVPNILAFIKAAAAEQAPDAVVEATEASLSSMLHLSDTETTARCLAFPLLITSPDNTPAGLAVYLYTFSTWMASPGVCLEELYVLPEYRRMGYARLLIRAMAREAYKAGCSKMEWVCLEGNERALRFYESLGAKRMDDWVVLKVGRDGIMGLAEAEEQ